ncbi:hypothetical protein ABT317_26020, partial [Streptomyces carpinensis]
MDHLLYAQVFLGGDHRDTAVSDTFDIPADQPGSTALQQRAVRRKPATTAAPLNRPVAGGPSMTDDAGRNAAH